MIDGIVQLLTNLITGLLQAFGFRNYNTWSNAHSASSKQRWEDERRPLQQPEYEQIQDQEQQPEEQQREA